MKTHVLAIAAVIAVAGCATALPRVAADQVLRAQQRWPDTTPQMLEKGRETYAMRCSGCHALPMPASRTADEWPSLLDEMEEDAHLTQVERAAVERYLLTAAADAKRLAARPQPQTRLVQ